MRGKNLFLIIVSLVLIIVSFFLGMQYKDNSNGELTDFLQSTPSPSSNIVSSTLPTLSFPIFNTSLPSTASWKSQSDPVSAYSFMYPSNWIKPEIREGGGDGLVLQTSNFNYADLTSRDSHGVSKGAYIAMPTNIGTTPFLETYLIKSEQLDEYSLFLADTRDVLLDGQKAKVQVIFSKYETEMRVAFEYPSYFSKTRYSMISLSSAPNEFDQYKQQFDYILATFKFIEEQE